MPVDDHLRVFVEESRESIDAINDGLLTLESDPDDGEAMDAVFRAAHTVKGNAAAMGFEEASSLAHALEDLLDEVREGDVEVTAELVDLLFEGVDSLESLLAEIGEHGETRTDTAEVRDRLRAVIGDDADDADDEESADAATESTVPDAAPDVPLVRTTVAVGDDMPGVDAVFVIQALEDRFESVHTDPGREAVEAGEFDGTFDVYVPGDDPDSVVAGVEALSKVESAEAALAGDAHEESPASGTTDTAATDAEPTSSAESADAGDDTTAEGGTTDSDGTTDEQAAEGTDEQAAEGPDTCEYLEHPAVVLVDCDVQTTVARLDLLCRARNRVRAWTWRELVAAGR